MVFPSVHWHSNALKSNLWVLALFFGLIIALIRHDFLLPEATDPYHCKSITKSGTWLERDTKLNNWQAPDCMLHHYQSKDVGTCLKGQRVLFIGDSTARQVFYGAMRTIDSELKDDLSMDKSPHIVKNLNGVSFESYWDPFMNQAGFTELKNTTINNQTIAAVYVSYGMRFLLDLDEANAPKEFRKNLKKVRDVLTANTTFNFGTAMISPIIVPHKKKLTGNRKKLTKDRVEKFNSYLEEEFSGSKVYLPSVFNQLPEGRDDSFDSTGIMFSPQLSNLQADVLLNIHCNTAISNHFPYGNTCCLKYPSPSGLWFFTIAALFVIPLGLVTYYFVNFDTASSGANAQRVKLHMALLGLCLGVGYCYLADRTQIFSKGNKNYQSSEFIFLSVVSVIAGLLSVKSSSDPKSTGFLNRHMTDEWKGWMQIAILIYHITGASKILPIYKVIRVLVASYLFMTGYGHAAFFTLKGDFGLKRVVSVLCRLNLLTVFLAYAMDNNYIFYYFSPLVTFWFGAIWITFRILPQYNSGLKSSLIKVFISGCCVYLFVKVPGPFETIFWFLKTFAAIDWNLTEWRFRVFLDIWAVHFGMVVSILTNNPELADFRAKLRQFRFIGVLAGFGLMFFYWAVASRYTIKTEYNQHNNYLALFPILGYVLVRNGSDFLCCRHSRFFGWFGKISLETFILQFHIWMAADTKGVLYILGMGIEQGGSYKEVIQSYGSRHLWNFILITVIFLLVSEQVANASGVITTWIVSPEKFSAAHAADDIEMQTRGSTTGASTQSLVGRNNGAVKRLGGKLGALLGNLMLDIRFRLIFILGALYLANIFW